VTCDYLSMDKILSLACETHGYTIPPLNNIRENVIFSQMDHKYAPTMTKYHHYFQQKNLSILWHKQALAHTHLGTRAWDVISSLLGPISTSHFPISHGNLHLSALNGGQIALNLGSTYIPTPFDEFFFKYRRRVYQIWKGMLIDYSPTYSVVVTVTMQRNNAIVIGILRRDGSRATSTLTSWKVSFKLCKLLFL
jgi:hypothetical protein